MTHANISNLHLKIVERSPDELSAYTNNTRTHSPKQVAQIAASMRQFGFVSPVLIDDDGEIIAGHGRVDAAKKLGLKSVPTITLSHLTEAERKAYRIADNRLAELSGWDDDLLKVEFAELDSLDLDFEIEITGFDTAELDMMLDPTPANDVAEEQDADDEVFEPEAEAVTLPGDVWILGEHRLVCGDTQKPETLDALMQGERADMVFTDPPYNVKIDGHVCGLGNVKHREFAMGAGEMSEDEFTRFLTASLSSLSDVSRDGAIHYVCMDWRHMGELMSAGSVYSELKNLVIWSKTNAGMGTFYRSQHELIFVYKVGKAAHTNTFGLGEKGRYRTNVWTYPGVNAFGKGQKDLELHPTVKPVALVADAIKDVTRRGEIVLDGFGGSGTTLIAAERAGRRARLIELDPVYCDVICKRFEARTGKPAVLDGVDATFDEVAAARAEPGDADGAEEAA